MTVYYADIDVSGSGGDGSLANPWESDSFKTATNGILSSGDVIQVRGSHDYLGGPTGFNVKGGGNTDITIEPWGTAPWRIKIGNTFSIIASTIKGGIIDLGGDNLQLFSNCSILSCFIQSAGGTLRVFNTPVTIKGSSLYFPQMLSSTNWTDVTAFTDCVMTMMSFTNCDGNTSVNCVSTAAVISGLTTNCQLNWSAPAAPAWNAAQSAFDSAVLSVDILTPPEPGIPPYTGYTEGLFGSTRIGIGAMDFTTIPTPPQVGDRYIAKVTANGWTKDYIYEFDGTQWTETAPVEGACVVVKELFDTYTFLNGQWTENNTPWLDPIISIFDNTSALPVAPSNGDRYIALVTANTWTKDYVYEWNGNTWVATTPVVGMFVYNNDTTYTYLYTGAAWVVFSPLTVHAIGGPLHSASTVTDIKTKVSGPDFLLTSQAAEISTMTVKATPAETDIVVIEDSADSYKKKKALLSTINAVSESVRVNTRQTYISNTVDTPSGYFKFTDTETTPDTNFSVAVKQADGEKLLAGFIVPSPIGLASIPAGLWAFQTCADADTGGVTDMIVRVYKRTSGGVETELFNFTTTPILDAAITKQYDKVIAQSAISGLNTTDFLVVKYFVQTTNVTDITVYLTTHNSGYNNGNNATNLIFPLPQLVNLATGAFGLTGIITDTVSSKQDNYNPVGLSDASTIQITLTGDQTITGIAGGFAGRILIIQSGYTGSTDKLTLKNNSGDSLAANRFYCPLSQDFVMSDDNSVILQYDAVQERWIVISTNQAPYGTAQNTICEGNDSRLSNARTPTAHASTHNAGGSDVMAIDSAAATGSLRTLGTGATQACAGNDSRLSDSRTPTAHNLAGSLHNADTITNLNTKLSDGDVISTKAGEINALSSDTTPLAADALLMEDSGDSFSKKKLLITNLMKLAFSEMQFFADQLKTPVSSEWPRYGTDAATLAQDSLNNAILERQFDDTVNEGTALDVLIPSGATNIIFDFVSRAQTAPATAKQVLPGIYTRQTTDNAAPSSFSSLVALTAIDIPASTAWQYDTQTIALSTLSLTAERLTQILLERTATSATDNLVGDWNLQLVRIRFS